MDIQILWGKLVVEVLLAMIAALPPSLLAYAALRQGQTNGRDVNIVKDKADQIHILTNSNLTAVKADLILANDRIATLQTLVAKLGEEAKARPPTLAQ